MKISSFIDAIYSIFRVSAELFTEALKNYHDPRNSMLKRQDRAHSVRD